MIKHSSAAVNPAADVTAMVVSVPLPSTAAVVVVTFGVVCCRTNRREVTLLMASPAALVRGMVELLYSM
jgi:hypothetical protein